MKGEELPGDAVQEPFPHAGVDPERKSTMKAHLYLMVVLILLLESLAIACNGIMLSPPV
tara:strand:+ start:991 stop:1167 length:177 start_codon:yes stop_codon:yes gene_type:complete